MKIHYVRALIERDPMTVIPVCVLATAIPVLQMVHGGKLTDVHVQDQCSDLDAEAEYDRLARVYGERPKTGKTYAEEIYGSAAGLETRMAIPTPQAADESPETDDPDDADPADIFNVGAGVPEKRQRRSRAVA